MASRIADISSELYDQVIPVFHSESKGQEPVKYFRTKYAIDSNLPDLRKFVYCTLQQLESHLPNND